MRVVLLPQDAAAGRRRRMQPQDAVRVSTQYAARSQ
jgi:hypothetical protein